MIQSNADSVNSFKKDYLKALETAEDLSPLELDEIALELKGLQGHCTHSLLMADTQEARGLDYTDPLLINYYRSLSDVLSREFRSEFKKAIVAHTGKSTPLEKLIRGWGLEESELDEAADLASLLSYSVLVSKLISSTQENTLTFLSVAVGRTVLEELKFKQFLKGLDEKTRAWTEKNLKLRCFLQYKRALSSRVQTLQETEEPLFFNEEEAAVLGTLCLMILLKNCNHFEVKTVFRNKKTVRTVIRTAAFIEAWNRSRGYLAQNIIQDRPMIVPPRPYTNLFDGGFYISRPGRPDSGLLRINYRLNENDFSKRYKEALDKADLSRVLKAVNFIQSTPWKINKRVLQVLQLLNKTGGGVGDLTADYETRALSRPIRPVDAEPTVLKAWRKSVRNWEKADLTEAGRLIKANIILNTAEDFADYEKIYMVCALDWRGRVYTRSCLSFQGNDLEKGLLLFSGDIKPIGNVSDLDYLFIHGANTFGLDKKPFNERIQWIRDHKTEILKSAADPLGYEFWQAASDPFQFLAFCFTMADLDAYISKNGVAVGFVCDLPVRFDATCSALQHYACLSKDPILAETVNLKESSWDKVPADVYSVVLNSIKTCIKKDADKGTEDSQADGYDDQVYTKLGTRNLALLWLNYRNHDGSGLSRKNVKRCCMTYTYGATEFAFKENVKKFINEEGQRDYFGPALLDAALYLGSLIFKTMENDKNLIQSAATLKNWMKAAAETLSEKKDSLPIAWTTPLGLPVQQYYLKAGPVKSIQISILQKRVRIYSSEKLTMINPRKQIQSLSPNFIHSLDATHLMMAVLNSSSKGIKHFMLIHDCFGCPVSQAAELLSTLKETFIELYETDPLKAFRDALQEQTEEPLPELPAEGAWDINEIKKSTYSFS